MIDYKKWRDTFRTWCTYWELSDRFFELWMETWDKDYIKAWERAEMNKDRLWEELKQIEKEEVA